MFKVGVSISPTKSKFSSILFSGNLDKGLKNASILGYDGVELSLLDSHDIDWEWIMERLENLGLHVYTIATGQTYYTDGYSLFSMEEDKRKKAVDRVKGHIDFASRLGSMVIIGGIRGETAEKERKLEQAKEGKLAISECADYAEKKGVILLLEPINRYETNLINTLDEGVELIEEIGNKNLKLLPDTFHMNIEEKSLEESLFRARSYIEYIHFADSNRLAPGWGHIDFDRIVATLKKIDYRGAVGIEILPEPDDYRAAKQAISYVRLLEEKLNQKKGQ